jgi:hypothetical protein
MRISRRQLPLVAADVLGAHHLTLLDMRGSFGNGRGGLLYERVIAAPVTRGDLKRVEPKCAERRTPGMSSTEPGPGARRVVPVMEHTGELAASPGVRLWACEQFDGLLWQLVGMARDDKERRAFLRGERPTGAV